MRGLPGRSPTGYLLVGEGNGSEAACSGSSLSPFPGVKMPRYLMELTHDQLYLLQASLASCLMPNVPEAAIARSLVTTKYQEMGQQAVEELRDKILALHEQMVKDGVCPDVTSQV